MLNGWFNGVAIKLKIQKKIFHGHSKHKKIEGI